MTIVTSFNVNLRAMIQQYPRQFEIATVACLDNGARRGVVLGLGKLGCLGPDSGLPALVFYDGSSPRVEPLFDDDAQAVGRA